MSGGSMNYLYSTVNDVEFALSSPLRRAFKAHLGLVAAAMREIEWADSCDTAPHNEDEEKAILACISTGALLDQVKKEAEELKTSIEGLLAQVSK